MMSYVDVVGFGISIDDLTEKHKKIIQSAETLVGSRRHLELLNGVSCEKIAITKDIQSLIETIKDRAGQGRRVVVVASGDPLFHGIGKTLINAMGRDNINIYPNISSVASAFAAIKEPWDDAIFISLHGKESDIETTKLHDILISGDNAFYSNRVIAILTDHIKTPAWIAKYLIKNNITSHAMYLFENLGAESQKISFYSNIKDAANMIFTTPNLVILKKLASQEKELPLKKIQTKSPLPIYLGMPDDLFFHQKGLITKSEIRAIVISKLELTSNDHIFWDLGAGSGSVSIEVSKFIPDGKIFALEKSGDRVEDIKKNMERFGIKSEQRVGGQGSCVMRVIHNDLLNVIDDLPKPDRVFIGGGGANISEIIKRVGDMLDLNGIVVINTVLLQTMTLAMESLNKMAFHVKLTQVQVSNSKAMPFGDRLEALNPVWIISGKKIKTRV
ncbi:MAG: precorrin-6y C5,15-methyltransferase (decarboxylating) subunit CbiE [Desulfamplus sp.]|nr:precorrin-6y C5,15-methyltransferase (decarboxylating) subunit CbiE [Desulfamplus sp.]